ncbi:MAG TPA: hypothetical protein VMX74_11760 [Pirellulales bacterium]|nr:hypothetical protein [Pirellulales bacterium]
MAGELHEKGEPFMKLQQLALGVVFVAAALTSVGCHRRHMNNLPPASQLMEPGPGVGGPGPGVMMAGYNAGMPGPMPPPGGGGGGGMPGCGPGGPGGPPQVASQLSFASPQGLRVTWDTAGQGFFDSEPLVVPGRQNFTQGAIYRVKLTHIPGRPGEEYYPTIEVAPRTPRTEAYLAHNAIPIQFVATDFDQIQAGNFVTKVIYLPDPDYQELALGGIEELVSTRLDPGVDPIREADHRGSILTIIRLGNKNFGIPGTLPGEAGNVETVGYNAPMPAGMMPVGPGGYPPMMGGSPGPMPGGPMPGGPMGGGPMGGGPFPGMATGGEMMMGPMGGMPGPQPMGLAPSHIAGVTAPQYGMPMSGTPIGLPGPPHVPMGIPAGLQKHVIKNKTRIHLPKPTKHMHIAVEQKPGMSYPKPPNHVQIVEEASRDRHGPVRQPFWDKFQWIKH